MATRKPNPKKELIKAIRQNDEWKVGRLLNDGLNPNFTETIRYKEPKGYTKDYTPLNLVAQLAADYAWDVIGENFNMMTLLVEAGADVNAAVHFQETPLMIISSSKLLERSGEWLMRHAYFINRDEIAQRLLGIAQFLLSNGAKLDMTDRDGKTSLMMAAEHGNSALVKLYLDRGAEVDAQDEKHNTALLYAVSQGHIETIKVLLEKGAALDIQNDAGFTPITIISPFGTSNISDEKQQQMKELMDAEQVRRAQRELDVVAGQDKPNNNDITIL